MVNRLKLEDLQSFEDLFAPKEPPREARQEQRRSDRKAMVLKGSITIDGTVSDIETVDVSLGGLSVRAARLLGVGKETYISFSLADGQAVMATVRIVYCFFTQDGDFRAGMEFLSVTAGAGALKQLLAD